jgi:hypothetical protein
MSANDEAWRRPSGQPGNESPSGPAASQPPPPAPRPAPGPAPRPEDKVWTRPPAGQAVPAGSGGAPGPAGASANGAGPATPVVPEYAGPPRSNPPPAAWRPPIVAEPPPPGTLPEQDHDRIDVEEQAARTLTTGIGLVVGALCLVLLLILCARALFQS